MHSRHRPISASSYNTIGTYKTPIIHGTNIKAATQMSEQHRAITIHCQTFQLVSVAKVAIFSVLRTKITKISSPHHRILELMIRHPLKRARISTKFCKKSHFPLFNT